MDTNIGINYALNNFTRLTLWVFQMNSKKDDGYAVILEYPLKIVILMKNQQF
jgi:hypothetical protein